MRTTSKLITFSIQLQQNINLIGLKILKNTELKHLLTVLQKLINNNSTFQIMNHTYQYSKQYFTITNVSSNEINTLTRLLDFTENDYSEDTTIGFFPDILNDAYEEGLINDEEESDEQEQDQYDDDDEF